MRRKKIAILGSTGSIGVQALEVIGDHPEQFEVVALTANTNWELLARQADQFAPEVVAISTANHAPALKEAISNKKIQVLAGKDSIQEVAALPESDLLITAVVGYAGLLPTLKAIEAGTDIALSNKETLVVAGELVNRKLKENKVQMIPVDSEHSAIYQCLVGEEKNPIRRVILTASGGPFRGKDREYLKVVKKAQALKHPNWDMGAKITIDSATLMNKGLEVIEAKWLFGLRDDQIEVVVHPQSVIHSMVEFEDTSIKAQLGYPDMKLPILYAMGYPNRMKSTLKPFDFIKHPTLSFESPDLDTFRNLKLAYDSMKKGRNYPCILNAANEIAVEAFLHDRIGFLEISDIIEESLASVEEINEPTLEDLIYTDTTTRKFALDKIQEWKD